MTTKIAEQEMVLVHQVRLEHATTGERIAVGSARLLAPPNGWWLRMVEGQVVVSARSDRLTVAAPPVLEVVIADGVLADLLQLPPRAPDQPPRSVRVTLTNPEHEVALTPQPLTLTVVLVDSTGAPSTGRTVIVTNGGGPAVQLDETTTDGTYRSDPQVWDRAHSPGDLRIGGTPVRKVGVDVRRSDTRLYIVDPT